MPRRWGWKENVYGSFPPSRNVLGISKQLRKLLGILLLYINHIYIHIRLVFV